MAGGTEDAKGVKEAKEAFGGYKSGTYTPLVLVYNQMVVAYKEMPVFLHHLQ